MSRVEVAMRRKSLAYLVPADRPMPGTSTSPVSNEFLAAAVGNLFRMGYMLNTEALQAAQSTSVENITALLAAAMKNKGGQAYEPMYPNFPQQVAEASHLELFFNAALHYVGDAIGVRIIPEYAKIGRDVLSESVELRILGLGSDSDLVDIAQELVSQASPYAEQDRDDLIGLHSYVANVERVTSIHENAAWLAVSFPHLNWDDNFTVPTDALRLASAYSGGDPSLGEPVRFRLKRFQRRHVMHVLDKTVNEINAGDMLMYEEEWKRLAKAVHPHDYPQCVNAKIAFTDFKSGALRTFNSRVEEAMSTGDATKIAELLSTRPGVFIRRVVEAVRKADEPTVIIDAFRKMSVMMPVASLVSLHNLLNVPETVDVRYVNVKSQRSLLKMKNKKSEHNGALVEAIEFGLSQVGDGVKVYVKNGTGFTVPTSVRHASSGRSIIARGSRMPLPDGGTVRSFIHWKDDSLTNYDSRIDLDLSMLMVSEDFVCSTTVAYYNLRSLGAVSSGDITSAPNGASEYVDVPIDAVLDEGMRYIMPIVYSYTRQTFEDMPDARAGFMMREKPDSGEIFESATVKDAYSLTGSSMNNTPYVIDLKNREVIWFDSDIRPDNARVNNVHNNEDNFVLAVKELVNTRPLTVEQLVNLMGVTVVENEDEADIVVDGSQAGTVTQLFTV